MHHINVHNCSMNLDKDIMMVDHPVLTGYYLAFLDHYPIVLSPDILWMLILQGFSFVLWSSGNGLTFQH